MRTIRKHLRQFCCLMAAVWVFSLVAAALQGCLQAAALGQPGPLPAIASGHALGDGHPSHPDQATANCARHCADASAGTVKPPQAGMMLAAVFVLLAYGLLQLALQLRAGLASPRRPAIWAVVADPPATIRFHRFND